MNDHPTTDSTPAWYTPPDGGATAPPRAAPMQPPRPPAVPTDTFAVTRPGETYAAAEPPERRAAAPPSVTLAATPPTEAFAVTPPAAAPRQAATSAVDFWPVASPAADEPPDAPAPDATAAEWGAPGAPISSPAPTMTALAPPTPLVRPIVTIVPSAKTARSTSPTERDAHDDGGGRGWRVRAGHGALDDEPARPLGTMLDPMRAADEPAAFVMPLMPWEKRHRRRPVRRYVLFGVGLFALFGLAALALTTVGRFAHGIQQPQTIGGLVQVETPSVQTTLDSLQQYEQSLGASNVVTGAYGAQTETQMMLVVVQGTMFANGGTVPAVQSFVHGVVAGASSVGWTLDPSKVTTSTVDGTTFECDQGPASANGGAVLSMCAWTDPGVAGAVVDITGQSLTDVLNETVQARAASEH